MICRWLAGCGFVTHLRAYGQVRQEIMQDSSWKSSWLGRISVSSRLLAVGEALLQQPDSFLNPGCEEAEVPDF